MHTGEIVESSPIMGPYVTPGLFSSLVPFAAKENSGWEPLEILTVMFLHLKKKMIQLIYL